MSAAEALTRLAAAGRIRSAWLPGMLLTSGDRVTAWEDGELTLAPGYIDSYEWTPGPDDAPADNDPATTGCLLALLREATRDPSVYLTPNADSEIRPDGTSPLWFAYTGRGKGPIGVGPTEHAAIVAALVAVAESL